MTDRVEALVLRARAPATRAARAADTAARILLEIADMVLESGWGWWRAGSWLRQREPKRTSSVLQRLLCFDFFEAGPLPPSV